MREPGTDATLIDAAAHRFGGPLTAAMAGTTWPLFTGDRQPCAPIHSSPPYAYPPRTLALQIMRQARAHARTGQSARSGPRCSHNFHPPRVGDRISYWNSGKGYMAIVDKVE